MKSRVLFIILLVLTGLSKLLYAQEIVETPFASISGKTSGEIYVSELVGQFFRVSDDSYKVVSFKLTVIKPDQTLKELEVSSEMFNKAASNQIRTAPEGTKVLIDLIVAENQRGEAIRLAPMNFVIVKQEE